MRRGNPLSPPVQLNGQKYLRPTYSASTRLFPGTPAARALFSVYIPGVSVANVINLVVVMLDLDS